MKILSSTKEADFAAGKKTIVSSTKHLAMQSSKTGLSSRDTDGTAARAERMVINSDEYANAFSVGSPLLAPDNWAS